jgi:hypothetical protein
MAVSLPTLEIFQEKKEILFYFILVSLFLNFFLKPFLVRRAPSHTFGTDGMAAGPPNLECA